MKKALLIIMVLLMAFSVTACSNGGDNGGNDAKDPLQEAIDTYSIDVESADEQVMSETRATKDQLSALKHDFFKDTMMFEGTEFEDVTYGDIKAELGVDASYYYRNGEEQCFVWQADGADASKLLISFLDGKIYGLGSANVS